uniref:acetyl-CoA carboxylase carboxyltransferase beta subunit n=1 Tax=Linum grandiflorum TaxID=559336 RepID=UPI001D12FF3C|nr:acetyl-CoA carboxylase carboxyltransferase beta subunit [Linum grandiflorum]UBK11707.1 acetyl-CoA carboxylase carboxyltransferase beta subunit [Linum grandiflorum]
MKKGWINLMLSNVNVGLESKCRLSKSMDNWDPLENTDVSQSPVLNDTDKNTYSSSYNDSSSSSYINVDHLIEVNNIRDLGADDTFLVMDSSRDNYSIYFDIENQAFEIENQVSFLFPSHFLSCFSSYSNSPSLPNGSRSDEDPSLSNTKWNNYINRCIDSFFRSQIDIDSSDSENSTESENQNSSGICIDSYILTESEIFTESENEIDTYILTDIENYIESENGICCLSISTNVNLPMQEGSNDLERPKNYSHLWVQCDDCYGLNYKKYFKSKMNICEHCGCHLQMTSSDRIELLIDPDTWVPMDEDMQSVDPIEFDSAEPDPEPINFLDLDFDWSKVDSSEYDCSEFYWVEPDSSESADSSELNSSDSVDPSESDSDEFDSYKHVSVDWLESDSVDWLDFHWDAYFLAKLFDGDSSESVDPGELDPIDSDLDDSDWDEFESDWYEFESDWDEFESDWDEFDSSESVDPSDSDSSESVDSSELDSEEEEKTYIERLYSYQEETGLTEAVQTGTGQLNGITLAIGVMDFRFIGGSMGSAVGEKITRLIEYAATNSLPLILVCASGGARMQEGSLSLMQMAKISSALYDYQVNKKLFFVSILTSPTTGGVTASFGMLGDIIIAEPNAYIAFAGKRVIEETLNIEVPEGSQEAEFLFDKGLFDLIVPRNLLKKVLNELFHLHALTH